MIYIGIDLGGTKINAAVFSLNGVILHQASAFLEGRKGPEVGQLMIEIARKLLSQTAARDETVSIGVCVPGIAYSKTGTVYQRMGKLSSAGRIATRLSPVGRPD